MAQTTGHGGQGDLGDDFARSHVGDLIARVGHGNGPPGIVQKQWGGLAVKCRAVGKITLAEHVGGGDAGQALQGLVPEGDPAVPVHGKGGVGQKIDDFREAAIPGLDAGLGLAQFADALGLLEIGHGQGREVVGEVVQGLADFFKPGQGHPRHLGQGGPEGRLIGPDLPGIGGQGLKVGLFVQDLPHHPVGDVVVADMNGRAAVEKTAAQAPSDQGAARQPLAQAEVGADAVVQALGRAANDFGAQGGEIARPGQRPALGIGYQRGHARSGGKSVLDALDFFNVE